MACSWLLIAAEERGKLASGYLAELSERSGGGAGMKVERGILPVVQIHSSRQRLQTMYIVVCGRMGLASSG